MESLQYLGIDPSLLLGFAVASLLSWLWADGAIQALYTRRFMELTEGNPDQTLRAAQAKSELWRAKLDLDFGKRIGRIPRIFYIDSVMLGQFSLLSAWVILKAFHGWIQKPGVAQSAPDGDKEITTFYACVLGQGIRCKRVII